MNRFVDSEAMDLEQIQEGIRVFVTAGDVHAVRAPRPEGRGTAIGYFSDPQKMAKAVADESGGWTKGVCMTLNPCDPSLLAHANNHINWEMTPTLDREIVRRLWFLADLDPIRPDEVSSSAPEKLAATVKARDVLAYLSQRGWPQPIPMDSGNGYQLRYRIDLPNDEESTQLVKRCLQALAARFDDTGVKLDASAFGAACMGAVPGTLATLGVSTPPRPTRITGLMKFKAEDVRVVSKELLQALAAEAPKEERVVPKRQKSEEFVINPSDRSHAEKKELWVHRNSDNDDLLPRGFGEFVLGYVDEVNGEGAQEIPSYIPTRHEIRELVKYWHRQFLDKDWFYFLSGEPGGSRDWRLGMFANRRCDRANEVIGKEAVDAALKEAREEFRARKDDRLWEIYDHGTAEQVQAMRDEFH